MLVFQICILALPASVRAGFSTLLWTVGVRNCFTEQSKQDFLLHEKLQTTPNLVEEEHSSPDGLS